ncbi:hypothetical protein TNIN_106941 [Trichonephila inaurata madagascariensis]|uniref:Uncharacterized protein n=1 Tax=Trichonephila inaurata madagascariensis TaxID=2747483 RepID=A0A8X6YVA3_9ARAC|nr:hypothetical protein TNIN_106941 [Trichonephila inaurata madagascariensis]
MWSTDVRFLLHVKNCFEIVAGRESAPENKVNRRELKDFNACQGGNVTIEVLLHHLVHLIDNPENMGQAQNYIGIRLCLHLLGLLCQVMSSNVILFEVLDETDTIHLRTEMT